MAEQISYFEAASYLADIEAEYADIADTAKRTSELEAFKSNGLRTR